jgi:hypothetical protein
VTVIASFLEYGSSNIAVDTKKKKPHTSVTSDVVLIILSLYIEIELVFLLLIF